MDRDDLQQHMISTYTYLRLGLGGIALVLPLFLWFVGLGWYGIPLQGSLSAYYFASPEQAVVPEPIRTELASSHDANLDAFLYFLGQTDAVTPLRSWFVGALFVIGAFLIFYKGFTVPENVALNIAGFSALGVAIFPMAHGCEPNCPSVTLHGIFAALTFGSVACVAIFCTQSTLKYLPATVDRSFFVWGYRLTGAAMVLLPVAAFLFSGPLGYSPNVVYWVEAFGIWAFASFWLLKSFELMRSRAEHRILNAQPPAPSDPPASPGAAAAY